MTNKRKTIFGFSGAVMALGIWAVSIQSLPQPLVSDENVSIGFWNLRDLSSTSRNQDERKLIAHGIKPFDIMVIVEVHDPEIIRSIAKILGPRWKHRVSGFVGDNAYTAERYAVLYRSTHRLIDSYVLPEIQIDDHTVDREPWVLRFMIQGREIHVMAAHVTYGESWQNRSAEVRGLVRYSERIPEPYLIMCDCNRDINSDSVAYLMRTLNMTEPTTNGPTTIRDTGDIDHIFAPRVPWIKSGGVFRFDELWFDDDDAAASLAVSDHRPIWVEVRRID